MQADRTSNYVDAIRSECSRREFSLIFCVLRSARADTYSSIKKLTCAEFGIPSQVYILFRIFSPMFVVKPILDLICFLTR